MRLQEELSEYDVLELLLSSVAISNGKVGEHEVRGARARLWPAVVVVVGGARRRSGALAWYMRMVGHLAKGPRW